MILQYFRVCHIDFDQDIINVKSNMFKNYINEIINIFKKYIINENYNFTFLGDIMKINIIMDKFGIYVQ